MGKQESSLETIWEVPDELWERIEPIILEEDVRSTSPGPHSALSHDRCSTASSSRLRSGCQWKPIAESSLGTTAPCHRTFQRWVGTGVLHRMWGALVEDLRRVGDGVDWEWLLPADGAMGKARFPSLET